NEGPPEPGLPRSRPTRRASPPPARAWTHCGEATPEPTAPTPTPLRTEQPGAPRVHVDEPVEGLPSTRSTIEHLRVEAGVPSYYLRRRRQARARRIRRIAF